MIFNTERKTLVNRQCIVYTFISKCMFATMLYVCICTCTFHVTKIVCVDVDICIHVHT